MIDAQSVVMTCCILSVNTAAAPTKAQLVSVFNEINTVQPCSCSNIDGVTGILVGLTARVPNSEEGNPRLLNIHFDVLLQSET